MANDELSHNAPFKGSTYLHHPHPHRDYREVHFRLEDEMRWYIFLREITMYTFIPAYFYRISAPGLRAHYDAGNKLLQRRDQLPSLGSQMHWINI